VGEIAIGFVLSTLPYILQSAKSLVSHIVILPLVQREAESNFLLSVGKAKQLVYPLIAAFCEPRFNVPLFADINVLDWENPK